jgi:hypothetical protein
MAKQHGTSQNSLSADQLARDRMDYEFIKRCLRRPQPGRSRAQPFHEDEAAFIRRCLATRHHQLQ